MHCARHPARWHEGDSWHLDRADRGRQFWLRVLNELKSRGVGDILIAVVDGLKGFPEAINAVFPQTVVQTCIVHLILHSLEFVSWKDRKPVVPALRAIYQAKGRRSRHEGP
ncbi:transposase [Mesorhizobium sp. M1182]